MSPAFSVGPRIINESGVCAERLNPSRSFDSVAANYWIQSQETESAAKTGCLLFITSQSRHAAVPRVRYPPGMFLKQGVCHAHQ